MSSNNCERPGVSPAFLGTVPQPPGMDGFTVRSLQWSLSLSESHFEKNVRKGPQNRGHKHQIGLLVTCTCDQRIKTSSCLHFQTE